MGPFYNLGISAKLLVLISKSVEVTGSQCPKLYLPHAVPCVVVALVMQIPKFPRSRPSSIPRLD